MMSNATPLICLAKINKLDILKKLFGKIIISEDIKKEILVEGKEGYQILNNALSQEWIKIDNPKKNISLGLGRGENSIINLAREKKDSLIIDDAVAIKMARSFGIECMRTTTLIILAVNNNLYKKKEGLSIINDLIKAGYYISPRHYIELANAFINSKFLR